MKKLAEMAKQQYLKYYRFLALLLFLLGSLFLLEQTKTLVLKENSDIMRAAALQTEAAFAALKEEKLARGFTIDPIADPNGTGMIGEPFTEITTTLGSLESKRSTTNPNTAAMIVDMLEQCGVKKGDAVAVNLSSSFPCLNIAVLCALDAVEARGVVINSVGASTYGANLPGFTYLDMEQVLLEKDLIHNHTTYFSLGGAGDLGKEMPEEIKNSITGRLRGFGLTFLHYEDLGENIAARQAVYESGAQPVCLISAGGNLLSFGGGAEMVSAHNGIVRPGKSRLGKSQPGKIRPGKEAGTAGLIPLYLEKGLPVIHLLNMKTLLPSYGLPFDPSPIPRAGEGGVYYTWHYNLPLAGLLLATGVMLFGWVVIHYPHRRMEF